MMAYLQNNYCLQVGLNLKTNVNSKNKISFNSNNDSKLRYSHKKYNSNIKKWENESIKQAINKSYNFWNRFFRRKQYLINQVTAVESKLNNYYPIIFFRY